MRMRRKRRLEERLAQVSEFLIPVSGERADVRLSVADKAYIDLERIFDRSAPLVLDIGCGFGQFSRLFAQKNPGLNVIGVERMTNVVCNAVEAARKAALPNLKYLNIRAECLPRYFQSGAVSEIFLNFPTPLPHGRTERQRLTYKSYVEIYRELLQADGKLTLRTDDGDFFAYSAGSLERGGFAVEQGADGAPEITTEHEEKYAAAGKMIFHLTASKKA